MVAGLLYVCGGHDGRQRLNSAERFSPATGAWEQLLPMVGRREGAAAAALRGRLYVCGGQDSYAYLSSAERFTPSTGTWEALPSMASRRWSAMSCVVGGRLYMCGGYSGRHLCSVERFNP